MCRKSEFCILLGNNPELWDKNVPLPIPDWFESQLTLFSLAVEKAVSGQIAEARDVLQMIRSDEMRQWFDEHGQMSGINRNKKLAIRVSPAPLAELDPIRAPKPIEKKVFERDSYTCRYCGLRLISKEVLSAMESLVGSASFGTKGKNAEQHGVVHAFKIVADHVVPHRQGGRTNLENLVSACPACNYGKYNFTVEQLGISDPRDRPPSNSKWDGLTSLIADLKKKKETPEREDTDTSG